MTPTEYRAALKSLGLTQTGAAAFMGVHPVTGRRWASDGPPPPVAKFLRLMLVLKFTPAYVDSMLG
jgi:hypothetical protein